ncbi:hypothetical protein B0H10DRAFT_2000803 [Mycena sp. CBHHK59/15]|nr:hypothetical protein B0H10DRAFT_2000803 [Mycena sp. CBHHK59/15]
MLNKKTQVTQNQNLSNKSAHSTTNSQHGLLLLHIPPESLIHITSNLDPRSLLALAQVNTSLSRHVKDDHTWHRAFVYQLLRIGPETDLHNTRCLLLRRAHSGSWRQEFILHFSVTRRWERSRNTTIVHDPLRLPISSMHLMPSQGLITSSLQYGVVSRSFPLTGRILRGYLDASGSGTGLGIGNPNTEFSANVSACALASDGGTAKILWGFRNGEVAFTVANKAMDAGSRSAAKFMRCNVGDEHQGPVLDVLWEGANAVTGGGDGWVKVWDAKKARCVWTSECRAPDEFVKVAAAMGKGLVAGAMRSGNIVVWCGFFSDMSETPATITMLNIPSPIQSEGSHVISGLFIDTCGPALALLVTFSDHAYFYRLAIDLATSFVECTKYGDPTLGAITSLSPFFTNQPGECSLVVTGTQLGCMGIYDWTSSCALPAYKFEANDDGSSVTALAWNGVILVTGCARGTTKVWDALTLEHLRTFATRKRVTALPGAAPTESPAVRQILLGPEKEVLLVAVADRVMAWRAGPVPKSGGIKAKNASGKKKERSTVSKYHQQLEMHQAIDDSRHLLEEESKYVQKAYDREREQRARLETLGLDEVEAVEYILMLSREEVIERERTAPAIEEGVFEADFDDAIDAPRTSPSYSPPSSANSSPPRTSAVQNGRPIPRASPSASSKSKIWVSPPFRSEPMEAPFGSSPSAARDIPPAPAHFPALGASSSPRGSPSPAKSAWSTPLSRSLAPSPGSSASRTASWGVNVGRASGSTSPSRSLGFKTSRVDDDDMDDDLRLAIELSLAEARRI